MKFGEALLARVGLPLNAGELVQSATHFVAPSRVRSALCRRWELLAVPYLKQKAEKNTHSYFFNLAAWRQTFASLVSLMRGTYTQKGPTTSTSVRRDVIKTRAGPKKEEEEK